MFPRARKLLTIGGIDVRADRSLLIIVLLIVWSFQSRWSPDFGATPALLMALAGSVLFFASLLAHELGHALEARHRGMSVSGVTLFLLGGVTEMGSEAERPRDEFAIAAVGPFVSLVAGAVFGLLATLVDLTANISEVENVLGLLGWLNVGLAVFNMIPASPLDGGRVLRAGLWALTKDRRKAIVLSARAGQAFALVVLAVVIRGVLAGDVGQALVNLMVAWFLWGAATAELRHVALDRLLSGAHAGGLDLDVANSVTAELSLVTIATELQGDPEASSSKGARPVEADGDIVGALVLADVLEVHPQDQPFRVVRDIMRPINELPRVPATTSVWDLLETFRNEPLILLELDDGRTTTVTSRQFGVALERLRRTRRGLSPATVTTGSAGGEA